MTQYTKHPCIETSMGKPRLKIVQYFYKELTLPKYREESTSTIDMDTNSLLDSMATSSSSFQSNPDFWNNEQYIKSVTKKIKRKFFDRIIDLFIERQKDPVETTFDKIKNAKGTLSDDTKAMVEVVTRLTNRAAQNGQTASAKEVFRHL